MERAYCSCGRERRPEQWDEVAAVLVQSEGRTALGDRAQHAQQFGRPTEEADVDFDLPRTNAPACSTPLPLPPPAGERRRGEHLPALHQNSAAMMTVD